MDALRAAFGPHVQLVWLRENGREVGKRSPECVGVGPAIEVGPWAEFKKRMWAEYRRKFGEAGLDNHDKWLRFLSDESVARFHDVKRKA